MSARNTLKTLVSALVINIAWVAPAAATTVVAQWNMDNTFGTTMVDTSGNGNNGTTYDVVTSGSGYMFNGTTSRVIVPDSPTLNPGTSDFTYSVQLQTDRIPPLGTDYDLIRKGTSISSGGEYKLEIIYSKGNGIALCAVKDAAGNIASIRGTTNVADGLLHTLTCIKTSTSLTVLVDALPPRSVSATLTGSLNSWRPFAIGVKQGLLNGPADDYFNGTMRSVSLSIEP